ncbi:hypothetical protein GCK72_006833 [Caenorhabditis remanei]|uniref:MATH domain-containing protein n=1 Tax=Caenorhabditis remanei TaxID=31234 RepID=A0A6A5HHB4_CAERE|nr:hypothetical protein GCK72_006833 [Caenorhabditis remanei]KAF1766875.1 hypothetical protein GCK72_006833 [Caenorhabditis remanei]
MIVRRTKEHFGFYLNCSKPTGTDNWTIETRQKDVFISNRVDNKVKEESITIFSKNAHTWGWEEFTKWDVLGKDFLVDDKLTAEMRKMGCSGKRLPCR